MRGMKRPVIDVSNMVIVSLFHGKFWAEKTMGERRWCLAGLR